MSTEHRTAVVSWAYGHCFKTGGWSIFHKDETALLNPPTEVLFFQQFGLDQEARANYVHPKPRKDSWLSQDYDERWKWTTILIPNALGHGNSHPLDWNTIKEMRAERDVVEKAILKSLAAEGARA